MRLARRILGGCAVVTLLVGLGVVIARQESAYELKLVVPSAAQLTVGSPVWIDGAEVGGVTRLEERDGKAIVTVDLPGADVPLHDGTTTRIEWKSVLGERVVTVYPGPAQNAPIPSGALYEAHSAQIEVDQVLAALDAPTRDRLNSLLQGLNRTLDGREADLQATLRSAGPAVQALGEILHAVGRDGPAIRAVVTQLHEVTAPLAQRQTAIADVVGDLTALTGAVAAEQDQLRDGLRELPATLDTARATLDKVAPASSATVPLLNDVRPATERLPSIAADLSPVMRDLEPVVAQLRPTLEAAQHLLELSPGLLDTGHDVIPEVRSALDGYQPALHFLRPYTPELAGWLTSWGQGFAGYNADSHVWALGLAGGLGEVNEHPALLPGERVRDEPAPGELVGQPWTDAHGSGMR